MCLRRLHGGQLNVRQRRHGFYGPYPTTRPCRRACCRPSLLCAGGSTALAGAGGHRPLRWWQRRRSRLQHVCELHTNVLVYAVVPARAAVSVQGELRRRVPTPTRRLLPQLQRQRTHPGTTCGAAALCSLLWLPVWRTCRFHGTTSRTRPHLARYDWTGAAHACERWAPASRLAPAVRR